MKHTYSFLSFILVVGLTFQAEAQWSIDPLVNNPISTAAGGQGTPTMTSDGAGGAIITWQDYRGSSDDVYVQRINSAGVVQWATNGVAVSTAAVYQVDPKMISDGGGGAIITWQDIRFSELKTATAVCTRLAQPESRYKTHITRSLK